MQEQPFEEIAGRELGRLYSAALFMCGGSASRAQDSIVDALGRAATEYPGPLVEDAAEWLEERVVMFCLDSETQSRPSPARGATACTTRRRAASPSWPGGRLCTQLQRGRDLAAAAGGRTAAFDGSIGRGVPPLGVFADGTLLAAQFRVYRFGEVKSGVSQDTMAYYHLSDGGEILDTIGVFPGGQTFVQQTEEMLSVSSVPFTPASSVVAWGSEVFCGTADRYEISVLSRDGRLLRLIRRAHEVQTVEPRDVGSYKRRLQERIPDENARKERAKELEQMPFPPAFPAYSGLRVDAEGNLWVSDYLRPDDEQPRWSVFNPQGEWLGTVAIPPRFTIHQIGADFVLGRALDEFDIERVVMHRLTKTPE